MPKRSIGVAVSELINEVLLSYMSTDDFLDDVIDTDEAFYVCRAFGVPKALCEEFWMDVLNSDAIKVEVVANEKMLESIVEKYRRSAQHSGTEKQPQ